MKKTKQNKTKQKNKNKTKKKKHPNLKSLTKVLQRKQVVVQWIIS